LARLFRIIDNQGSNLGRQNTLVANVFVVLDTKIQKTEATASGPCATEQANLMTHIQFVF